MPMIVAPVTNWADVHMRKDTSWFTESPSGVIPQFQWRTMFVSHVHQRSRSGTESLRLRGPSSPSICSGVRGGRRPT
jgi:hypothetical protein